MQVLPDDLADRARQKHPLPIANAIVELDASMSIHEQRDRVVEVFRAIVRTLGGLALAARISAGPGPKRPPNRELDERLARLRRQALTDGEWVGLTRELLRAWRDAPDAHPLPELVRVFHGPRATLHDGLDHLLGMRKRETVAHGSTGDESRVRDILEARAPVLRRVLEDLDRLWESCRIVLPLARRDVDGDAQHAWLLHGATPPRARWRVVPMHSDRGLAPGKPVVVDASGRVALALEPAVLFDHASPEEPGDLFFLDGRDRRSALYVAFPSTAEVRHPEVLEILEHALGGDQARRDDARAALERPYRGLSSYGPEHAELFFGREDLAVALANRISARAWTTLTGPSGSGKTSLLRAGVLPTLTSRVAREREAARDAAAGGVAYDVVTLRPGAAPVSALRSALHESIPVARLGEDPSSWAAEVLDVAASRQRVVVVVVDQAEELLTLCSSTSEREQFGAVLAALAPSDDAPVRIVLSLREDFCARLSQVRTIGARYQQGIQLVSTPAPDDLRRILVEPAARFEVRFEDGLADEIVRGVADQPAALALLSFTADRLWDTRTADGVLETASYVALGRVEGALANHADAVIDALSEAQREIARAVLLRLITQEGTRDVVSRGEIATSAAAESVIDRLVEERLVSAREGHAGERLVELAHEALVHHWARLRAWRDEDREAHRHLGELRAAARAWLARDRSRDALWRGALLAEHRALRARARLSLSDAEQAFVAASDAAESRGRRIAAGIAAAIGAVLTLLGATATWQWSIASAERDRAEDRERAAESALERARLQAMLALGERLDGEGESTEAFTMLTTAALAADDREAAREILEAPILAAAFSPYGISRALRGHGAPVRVVAFSEDGARIASGDDDGVVRAWDAATGRTLAESRHGGAITSVAFVGDEVVSSSRDGSVRRLDAATGRERSALPIGAPVRCARVAGEWIAIGGEDGVARLWRPDEPPRSIGAHALSIEAIDVASDGSRVVTGSRDGTASILDFATGAVVASLPHQGSVDVVQLSPDGRLLVTGSAAGEVALWDAQSGASLGTAPARATPVRAAAWSRDGAQIVTAAGGRITLWDAAPFRRKEERTVAETTIQALEVSRDGASLVVSLEGGTASVHQLRTRRLISVLRGHEGAVLAASFAPDGRTVVTASADRTLRTWRAAVDPVERVLRHDAEVVQGCLAGARVATVARDGAARIWSETGSPVLVRDPLGSIVDARADGDRIVTATARAVALLGADGDSIARVEGAGPLAWGRDGDRWIVALADGAVRAIEADGSVRELTPIAAGAPLAAGGGRIALARDGQVELWSLGRAERTASLAADGADLAVLSPDGTRLVTASSTRWQPPILWDGATGERIAELSGHGRVVTVVAFSPDGERIVTGSADESGRVWRAATGQLESTLLGHAEPITAASFSPDGARVGTASGDGTGRVWDAASGRMVAFLLAHDGPTLDLRFSSDGRRVITASIDGTARIWRLPTLDEIVARSASLTDLAVCEQDLSLVSVEDREGVWAPDDLCRGSGDGDAL